MHSEAVCISPFVSLELSVSLSSWALTLSLLQKKQKPSLGWCSQLLFLRYPLASMNKVHPFCHMWLVLTSVGLALVARLSLGQQNVVTSGVNASNKHNPTFECCLFVCFLN